MSIVPIGSRVLIKPQKRTEEKTKSGIILPTTDEGEHRGTIIAVGEAKEMPVKKGDIVIYDLIGESEINIDGEQHIILDTKNLIAKIG